jgi:hypothetical protein
VRWLARFNLGPTPRQLNGIPPFFRQDICCIYNRHRRSNRAANLINRKIMKQNVKVFLCSRSSYCVLIIAAVAFGVSASQAVAQEIAATYVTGREIPVRSDRFSAEGKTINITLGFAPPPGTQLMVVQNTGRGIIRGRFENLAQGQTITLTYAGLTYHFVANYYGGNGNDLVLLWTTGDELVPAVAKEKLEGQLLLALRKSRGEPPFDKRTSLQPTIPVKDGDRVLVDIEGSISKALLDRVTLMGGALPDNSKSSTRLRAMLPLSQLEALALRTDVKFISPAKVSVTSRIGPQ